MKKLSHGADKGFCRSCKTESDRAARACRHHMGATPQAWCEALQAQNKVWEKPVRALGTAFWWWWPDLRREAIKPAKPGQSCPKAMGLVLLTGYFGNNGWVNLRHGGSESGRQGGPRWGPQRTVSSYQPSPLATGYWPRKCLQAAWGWPPKQRPGSKGNRGSRRPALGRTGSKGLLLRSGNYWWGAGWLLWQRKGAKQLDG